jgi:hypothetical protein
MQIAIEKGWWEGERNEGELIALMHSELSEGLEAIRKGWASTITLDVNHAMRYYIT